MVNNFPNGSLLVDQCQTFNEEDAFLRSIIIIVVVVMEFLVRLLH